MVQDLFDKLSSEWSEQNARRDMGEGPECYGERFIHPCSLRACSRLPLIGRNTCFLNDSRGLRDVCLALASNRVSEHCVLRSTNGFVILWLWFLQGVQFQQIKLTSQWSHIFFQTFRQPYGIVKVQRTTPNIPGIPSAAATIWQINGNASSKNLTPFQFWAPSSCRPWGSCLRYLMVSLPLVDCNCSPR